MRLDRIKSKLMLNQLKPGSAFLRALFTRPGSSVIIVYIVNYLLYELIKFEGSFEMRNNVLDSVVKDLLSIPPFIRRSIRRKVFKTAFGRIKEHISFPHFEIMRTLKEKGILHIAEIGERLQIPKPQMTHLIDRLVSLDIVVRQTDVADRRITNIALTDKGRAMIEEHDRLIKGSIRENLSCLTGEELQELSVSLRKLRDILSKLQ